MKQYSKRTTTDHWLVFVLPLSALALGCLLAVNKISIHKLSAHSLHFVLGELLFSIVLLRIYFTDHMQEGVHLASDQHHQPGLFSQGR